MKRKAIEAADGSPVPKKSVHSSARDAHLGTYIREIIGSQSLKKQSGTKQGRMERVLSKDRINRVIFYCGSFNPPHQGHLQHLKHAFKGCGEDWNVVGAVVFVKKDAHLNTKFASQSPETLKFTRQQRAQLWKEGLAGENWAFVYTHELSWKTFSDKLAGATAANGYKIEFVQLLGGDYLSKSGDFQDTIKGKDFITTDVSRSLDFYDATRQDQPQQLSGYSAWTRLPVDDLAIKQSAVVETFHRLVLPRDEGDGQVNLQDLLSALGVNVDEYVKRVLHASKQDVWVCQSRKHEGKTVRFVHTDKQLDPTLSSTKVRGIIESTPVKDLEEELKSIALGPKHLFRYIKMIYKVK